MIDKLTPEQEAKIQVYYQEALDIGHSTQPLDRVAAEASVREIAKFLEIEVKDVRFYASPKAVAKARQADVGGDLYSSEALSFWYWTGYYVRYWYVLNELMPERKAEFALLGQVINWKNTLHFVEQAGGVFYVSERPIRLIKNASGLHNPNGMALEYGDGFGVYSLNGVRVPAWVVTKTADEFDFKEVMKIENVEIRREALRKAGVARLIKGLNAKVVDEADGYQVLKIDLGGEDNINYALRMQNPSIDVEHVEWVAPDCDTVKKALAFRNQEILKVTHNYFQQGDVLLGVLGETSIKNKESIKWVKPRLLT